MAVGATIGLSNFSTSEGALHYSRPVLERDAGVTKPRLFMSVPEIKDGSTAKNIETNSTAVAAEKSDAKKSRPAKPKVLARRRNNYDQPSYGNALGTLKITGTGHSAFFPTGEVSTQSVVAQRSIAKKEAAARRS